MHSTLTPGVARAITEDRLHAARGRARRREHAARPPSRRLVRRGAAAAVARVARRLDADAAQRILA